MGDRPALVWADGEAGSPVRRSTCGRAKINEMDTRAGAARNTWSVVLDGQKVGSGYAHGVREAKRWAEQEHQEGGPS